MLQAACPLLALAHKHARIHKYTLAERELAYQLLYVIMRDLLVCPSIASVCSFSFFPFDDNLLISIVVVKMTETHFIFKKHHIFIYR